MPVTVDNRFHHINGHSSCKDSYGYNAPGDSHACAPYSNCGPNGQRNQRATDSYGNVYTHAATFTDSSNLAVLALDGGSPGTYDDALDFAGLDSFSLEGWFRPEPPGPQAQHLLGKELPYGQDPPRGYGLTSNEDQLRFFRDFEGTVDEVVADPLTPYEFTYVVATYDGEASRMCLYKNAVLANCNEDATTSIAGHWGQFGVGYPGTVGYNHMRFDGVADEIAVYGKVLTEAQIDEHYQAAAR